MQNSPLFVDEVSFRDKALFIFFSFSYFYWSMIIKIVNNLIVQKDVEDWFCVVTLKRFPML